MDCKKKKKIQQLILIISWWINISENKNHLIISLEQFHKKQNQHCKFVLLQNIMFRTP